MRTIAAFVERLDDPRFVVRTLTAAVKSSERDELFSFLSGSPDVGVILVGTHALTTASSVAKLSNLSSGLVLACT